MNDFSTGVSLPAAPLPASGREVAERLDYDGRAGELAGIGVVNALLTLVTLGIYRFWAKTRVRRYLWSHVSFQGDRLEYTGRGLELFIGLLIALLILSPLIAASVAIDILYAADPAVVAVKGLVQLAVIVFLIQIAIYRARRYRLSRTQWRGIRLGQTGSSWKYALAAFGWMIVTALTLGLAYPLFSTRLQRYRTSNTWFGDRNLEFQGRAGELFGRWLLAWILWPPTLGLSAIWYRVREFRYFTEKTRLGSLQFRSDLSSLSVYLVLIGYLVVAAATIGLAVAALSVLAPGLFEAYQAAVTQEPGTAQEQGAGKVQLMLLPAILAVAVLLSVVQLVILIHPLARLVCRSIEISGSEDFAAIAQSRQRAPGRGEGLADALDVGAF